MSDSQFNTIVFSDLLPKEHSIRIILEHLDKLITDIILYVAYGIAILSGLKFIIFILNGFTPKSYMGPSSLDNSAF